MGNFAKEETVNFIGQNELGAEAVKDESLFSLDDLIFDDFKSRLTNEPEVEVNEFEDGDSQELLSLEQAVEDFNKGNQDAFDYIFMYYKPKLERQARRMNDEDLSQELAIVLYNAALSYKQGSNAKFNTFFWKCAQNHIGTKKIRKGAQKRGGSKNANKQELLDLKAKEKNGEALSREEQDRLLKLEEEAKPTKTISLQATFDTKDSAVEMGAFIEDKNYSNQYGDSRLKIDLEVLSESLKDKEMKAINMIIDGYTLEEIGKELGNITAPAVHVMLRRLGKKKNIQPKLREILS